MQRVLPSERLSSNQAFSRFTANLLLERWRFFCFYFDINEPITSPIENIVAPKLSIAKSISASMSFILLYQTGNSV